MAGTQFTETEIKGFMKDAIGLKNAIDSDALKYFENKYGALKGAEAFDLFKKAKLGVATAALSWDDKKSIGENIAYIAGDSTQGAIAVGIASVGLASLTTSAIAIFATGLLLNEALQAAGIDLGKVAQSTYNYANTITNINDIETANFNALPDEAKARMTAEGKYPGGPGWNAFLNEMSDYYANNFKEEIATIDKMAYTIQSGDTLQKLADTFNITLDELITANPWLNEQGRISEDKTYALIKPGETLALPDSATLAHPDGSPFTFDPNSAFAIRQCEPLALDMDNNGFIDTTTVQESETYFDLTGDGIKERTGWIKPQDALLVYDKNEDGKISGIDEVFGNATTEGFDELRELIDSNYDNKIDKRDILFNRLQLWHDLNQNGTVEEGELKSLKEAGITSIDLNAVLTTITTNGHTITQASRYTDTQDVYEKILPIYKKVS